MADPPTFKATGRGSGAYLLQTLDLMLKFYLPGSGVELAKARGAAAPTWPLAVQLVHLQVLQLSPQILDELCGREACWLQQ